MKIGQHYFNSLIPTNHCQLRMQFCLESRKLLGRLRDTLAEEGAGQERLDRITHLIADSMKAEVCSIYLVRAGDILELNPR